MNQPSSHPIRIQLPHHLRILAGLTQNQEILLEIEGEPTQRTLLDTLESRYPALRGTIRQRGTLERRPFLRFFACEADISHESPDAPLPEAVASGSEIFLILGAIAGG